MNIKEIIQTIIDNGRIEDMHELSDILEDALEVIERNDESRFKKYEMKLYEMAYGKTLSREYAEEIVSNMKPYGKRWSIEDTEQIQNQFGLDNINSIDFFVVMNSKFNDDRETVEKFAKSREEEIDMYTCLAKDFIMDDDAKEGKVFMYFTIIPE